MASEVPLDVSVPERLQALGVTLLSEWDALAFLHSHTAILTTAAQIAEFIGHDKTDIGTALRKLETSGLIKRSRISQGIRIYKLSAPIEPARSACLLELMSLNQNRTGRLLLLKHLKHPHQEPRRKRNSRLRLA